MADAVLVVDVDLDEVVGLEFGERGADGFEQGVGRRRWIGKAGLDDLRGIGQVGLALGPVRRSIIGEVWRPARDPRPRSEEHTSELQSLMRISYAVFCLKKKNNQTIIT